MTSIMCAGLVCKSFIVPSVHAPTLPTFFDEERNEVPTYSVSTSMRKSLPRVTDGRCSRRAILEGIGVAAIGGLLLAGCGSNGADLPNATVTTCGADTCIDLTDAANAVLAQTGGTMVFDAPDDRILIVRVSEGSVLALSAICTHEGCIVDYNASAQRIDCPCHGSEFGVDGHVIQGPAGVPLKVYTATLANNMITVAT
jgi:cytochrome b6-f complex iron-sulfur subunit